VLSLVVFDASDDWAMKSLAWSGLVSQWEAREVELKYLTAEELAEQAEFVLALECLYRR
jgi:hypothetical protein